MKNSDYDKALKIGKKMAKDYDAGTTVAALAKHYGFRREVVNYVLNKHGTGPESPARDRVLAYVGEHPGLSVDDLALHLGLSRSTISRHLRGTEEQKLIISRKHSDLSTYSEADMTGALRAAYKALGEDRSKGLSRLAYMRYADEHGDLPAASTYIRRYGSWTAACAHAGIPPAKTRRNNYVREWSDEAIVDAVEEYINATGETTFSGYAAWARKYNRPSGPLLIIRLTSWTNARQQVMQRYLETSA
jgi:DNA-binding transcriptional ArsR family regulator